LNVTRDGPDIEKALDAIKLLRNEDIPRIYSRSKDRRYNRNWIDAHEVMSAALTVEAIALSALARAESRGAHYRSDFAEQDEAFRSHGVIKEAGGVLALRHEEIPA
jgi:succinate dehydrogenase/fumarate reductase flavoprotein subunit